MNACFHRFNSWLCILAATIVGVLPLNSAWARAEVGRVQFVHGNVQILGTGGAQRAMLQREAVYEGDTLISAKSGYAQLRMVDDAVIALRPDTVLRIDTYHYHANQHDGSERGFFFLLKGGFRAITGAIGHNNKQNYLVTTPVATIGIRGTDHEPMFIPQPASGEIAIGEPGVYDLVNAGSAYIQTREGSVTINPNEVGFVRDIAAVPTILPRLPDFYKTSSRPVARATTMGTQQAREASQLDDKVKATPMLATDVDPYAVTVDQGLKQPVLDANGNVNLSSLGAGAILAPLGSGVVGADIYVSGFGQLTSSSSAHINDGSSSKDIFLASNQSMVAISDKSLGAGHAFISANGQLLDRGSLANGIQWGRWTGDIVRVEDGQLVSTLGSYHYMYSPNITTPTQLAAITGSYSYNLVAGTSPTDEGGRVGSIISASAAVDFTKQQITNYSVGVVIPAARTETWAASGNGSFQQFMGGSGIALAGTCTGCSVHGPTTAAGSASGGFVGAQAETMITSYNLQSSGNSVVGTAAFQR